MGYDPAHDYDDNPPIFNHTEGAPHQVADSRPDAVPFPTGRSCDRCGLAIMSTEICAETARGVFIHITCPVRLRPGDPSYHYTLREETTGDRARDICNRAADLVNNVTPDQ